MGINDLAIIYQSKIYRIKRKIDTLNKVGIKGQRYLNKLEEIERATTKQIEDYNREIKDKIYLKDLNVIYNNATAKIEIIEGELEKYNSYITGYRYCEYLDSKINGDKISEEEVKEYANNMIKYINSINETDTRDYNEEKEIVEKIYSVAYQVMKLEFITLGKSEIFETAKNNYVIESFISNEIAGDIHKLEDNNKITPLIKQSISRIQSNGINYSYLDKLLITSIALEDDSSIVNKIKEKLDELLEQMKNNVTNMESIKNEINNTERKLKEKKERVHVNNIYNLKEIIKRTIAGLIAAGILFGSYSLGRLVGKTKLYKTKKETYSTLNGYSNSEYRDEKVSNDELGTNLYKYEPYGEKNSDDNGDYYKRQYTKYNITNISDECKTLDDYLKLNLEHATSIKTDLENKNASDMTEEDFYDETIYEVVKIIQDLDDYTIKNSNPKKWLVTFLLVFIFGVLFYGGIMAHLLDKNFFEELENSEWEKEKIKELLIDLKNKLETFRRLADNNKEVKEEFTKIFNNYKELLESSNYINKTEENGSILIEDPQIELDKRTKRLIKSRVKE